MKQKRRVIAVLLMFVMAFTMLLGQTGTLETKAAVAHFDGNDYRMSGQIDEEFFDDSASNSYTKKARSGNYTLRKGIDVSHWQNDRGTIDWNAVKNSGVEFVIVKVGGRYNDGSFYTDKCYQQNIEGALAAGLRVGVYFWSEAITEAEAREEANFVVGCIYKYNITLPICMDYEWCPSQYRDSCRLYNSGQNAAQRTAVANAFMNQCAANGYAGMLYANKSTLRGSFDGNSLAANGRVWVANYSSPQWTCYGNATTNYEYPYDFFQFTSEGSVPGITGYVDLDYWYDDGTISGQDYSAVFDATYYADRYSDLKDAYGYNVGDLLNHFISYGMNEGRQGCSSFDPKSYYLEYGDLRNAYGTDWKKYYQHYMVYGKTEGRNGVGCTSLKGAITTLNGVNYASVYDYSYYVGRYSDIKQAFGYDDKAVLAHFVYYGMGEGRQAIASFNVTSYQLQYSDLRSVFGSNLKDYYLHYINYGKKEGRQGTGCTSLQGATTIYNGVNYASVYDYSYYVGRYSDIKQAFGYDDKAVLAHFVNYGMQEGRQAKTTFNVNSYINQYGDLRQAFGRNDLKQYYLHYINYGKQEGRAGTGCENRVVGATTVYQGVDYSDVYDYYYYINTYADIKSAMGLNDEATIAHFVNYGMNEGRQGKETFNVFTYSSNYQDLQQAFGDDYKSYFLHYIQFGKAEGRTAI